MLWKKGIPFLWILFFLLVWGCVSGTLKRVKYDNDLPTDLSKAEKEKFEIKDVSPSFRDPSNAEKLHAGRKKKGKSKKASLSSLKSQVVYPSRRPAQEPIWVGERLVFSISYFGVSAGDFSLEVLPHKFMEDRKVYHIRGNAVSSSVFSLFYRLNDMVETYLDYDGLFSHRFHVVLDETKQTRDSLELYDSEKKQTFYWNRWHHGNNEYTETKQYAPIVPFSQDSLSALYFVRTVPLTVGSVFEVPVISEGKGWEAVCTVLRKEMMRTPLGKVQTIVIRPEMKYQGILKKSGDSFLWVTDDDRRIPVRLEAKVKIGTVVASLNEVELGTPPIVEMAAPSSVTSPSPSPSPTRNLSSVPHPNP